MRIIKDTNRGSGRKYVMFDDVRYDTDSLTTETITLFLVTLFLSILPSSLLLYLFTVHLCAILCIFSNEHGAEFTDAV